MPSNLTALRWEGKSKPLDFERLNYGEFATIEMLPEGFMVQGANWFKAT
jgi:hypothetical protein